MSPTLDPPFPASLSEDANSEHGLPRVPGQVIFRLVKACEETDWWHPLERGRVELGAPAVEALRLTVRDPLGRVHAEALLETGAVEACFEPRGAPGWQTAELRAAVGGAVVASARFRVVAETSLSTDHAPMERLFGDLARALGGTVPRPPVHLGGRDHAVEVGWSRDHAFTLKSTRYFRRDPVSGIELWLRTQRPDGSFWDCFHENPSGKPNWFCEALGEGWFGYYENGKLMARRIPIEADVEYCIAEAVHHAWQASGDDAWARSWLPALERALLHSTSHPLRWSTRHGLVKRSFCMDSWDFAHPAYCAGDHRCLHPGDPAFLFHGDNSGLYQFHHQLAVMHEALGDPARAQTLRREAAALRERANATLFTGTHYGHMIPEDLPEEEVFAVVGNERERLSLSTGYTINRSLPDQAMAVAILDEYQRRRVEKQNESWAEWWTMDPPYSKEQWPKNGPPPGDYMNGGICLIAAGELAKAAFDHGREAYGADILERVAALPSKYGGIFAEVYRRLPENPAPHQPSTTPLDLRACANRGLRHGAHPDVIAWTGEGDNDLRNLPVGDQIFEGIGFHVLNPGENAGRAVLYLDRADPPVRLPVPPEAAQAGSLAFLHATAHGLPVSTPVALYRFCYDDGSTHPVFIRSGHEIGHWWGANPKMVAPPPRYDRPVTTALAWQGPNPVWKTTGVFVFSVNNPFPEKNLVAVEIDPSPLLAVPQGGLLLCAVSAVHDRAGLGVRQLSGGLPLCWALSSVFYGLMSGLVGIEDCSTAFRKVRIAPRFAATPARRARACLHYPASDTYCQYEWAFDPESPCIVLDLAGSFDQAEVHLLLPVGFNVANVHVGNRKIDFSISLVEGSTYLDLSLDGPPMGPLRICLQTL